MQGIKTMIPTKENKYIQSLLGCGFDTIDFGSFVSLRPFLKWWIRQGFGTNDLSRTTSKLLAIVANVRGAQNGVHPEIDYLGFPFSISENFQMRNTYKTIAESVTTLQEF